MKHIQVVAAIVIHNDKILCVQRGQNEYEYISLKYEFPGGKVKPNENYEEAIKREVKEELLMDIEVMGDYMIVEHQYPDFKITMKCFKCTCVTNKIVLTEHINHEWLLAEKLELLDWAAADIPVVKKLIEDQ